MFIPILVRRTCGLEAFLLNMFANKIRATSLCALRQCLLFCRCGTFLIGQMKHYLDFTSDIKEQFILLINELTFNVVARLHN